MEIMKAMAGSGPLAYELLTEGPKERSKMEGEQQKGVIGIGCGRSDKEEPICQDIPGYIKVDSIKERGSKIESKETHSWKEKSRKVLTVSVVRRVDKKKRICQGKPGIWVNIHLKREG